MSVVNFSKETKKNQFKWLLPDDCHFSSSTETCSLFVGVAYLYGFPAAAIEALQTSGTFTGINFVQVHLFEKISRVSLFAIGTRSFMSC